MVYEAIPVDQKQINGFRSYVNIKFVFAKKPDYFLLILSAIFFLFLLTHQPAFDLDSISYIHGSIIRQPLDPLFIGLFKWAGKNQLLFVMWTQSVLTFFSFYYARNWIRRNLFISDFFIMLAFICTFITVTFYYQIQHIDSEGLAFPLFIFAFFSLVECFKNANVYNIIKLNILISILILLRTQFYFFYPILFILLCWYGFKKMPSKFLLFFALTIIFFASLTNIADRTYHYVKHGYFKTEPLSGLILVIQPLFLSKSIVLDDFKNANDRDFAKSLLSNMYEPSKNLYLNKWNHYQSDYTAYSKIYNTILTDELNESADLLAENIFSVNQQADHIAVVLFQNNIKENLFFYGYKVINAFGRVSFFLFFLMMFFVSFISVFRNKFFASDQSGVFIFCSVLVMFFNALIICLAEPNLTVYYCYTQFLLYCLAAFLADRIFRRSAQ